MTTSRTLKTFPVLGCLAAAGDFLGKPCQWTAVSGPAGDTQRRFLERFTPTTRIHEINALGNTLQRKASADAKVINDWLSEKGWPDVKVPPPGGPDGFCVASVLDVLVEWIKLGNKTTIRVENASFPAVSIGKDGVSAVRVPGHDSPIVQLATKSGDTVFMTIHSQPASDDPFAIQSAVDTLRGKLANAVPVKQLLGTIFPMISHSDAEDLSWIINMRTFPAPDSHYIAYAVQRTRFRMNEQGARAQSAAAMALKRSGPVGEWVIIDKPFLLWIERKGIELPLFAGWFGTDSWKDPGGLE